MPNSKKARDVLDRVRDDARITRTALSGPLVDFRSALRALDVALSEIQWDLDEVDDLEDMQAGIFEMGQKVGGGKRELGKLRDQITRMEGIVQEIDDASRTIRTRLAEREAELLNRDAG